MKNTMKKVGVSVLTLAMVGSTLSVGAFAEESAADYGGAEVRVYGGPWGSLNPESTDDNAVALDAAAQLEAKYNIKFVYSAPDGYDGYNLSELILAGITSGDAGVDILTSDPDAFMTFVSSGAMVDLTEGMESMEIGSIYKEACSWQGKCYGMTHDNVGDVYMMVYSRDYLNQIGMDVTPTDKFMAGEWSYDECKEYLTEMKAKLPEGVYPMGIHYFHWASMAGAANGVLQVDSDGNINITDEHYLEAMTFYKELIDEGLACPITIERDENGEQTGDECYYATSDMAPAGDKFVIGRIESWQAGGMTDSVGEWGICMWPWGDDVTCDGDYTTLSDNYMTAQAYWAPTCIPVTAEEKTGIPAMELMNIAKEYFDLVNPNGAACRKAAWDAEQAGEVPAIGFESGTPRSFCTVEDYEIYDWAHTRVEYDWAKSFSDGGILDTWDLAARIIGEGEDARSAATSAYQQGVAKATELGVIAAQ